MPNLDTHAGLALIAHPELGVEFAAGEVFDDAVKMAGGLPNREAPPSLFRDGIRSNNAITDVAFDAQPALVAAKRAMEADMKTAGMASAIVRVCAGPGTDILFSGVSLQRAFDASSYLDVCDFMQSGEGIRRIGENTRPDTRRNQSIDEICATVGLIAHHGLRPEYADPAFVVSRLRKRVAHLPPLAMPDSPTLDRALVEIFASQQARLTLAADEIYAGTIAAVTGNTLAEVRTQTGSPLLPITPHVSSLVENTNNALGISRIEGWKSILARESATISNENEQYQRQFAASRAAAHFLLQNVVHYPDPVIISRWGAGPPNLPPPLLGSITHSGNWAAAAITSQDDYRGIGIDLECRLNPLRGRNRVLTLAEQALPELGALNTRTLFSIKEAVFKAIHPLVKHKHPNAFWFHDAEITEDDIIARKVTVRLAATERGRAVEAALGSSLIECYYLEKDFYSSAVCVVHND